MTLSSRLALAMVLLAVVTSCIVGGFTWHFLSQSAAPQGVTIGYAVLAGGAIAVLLALALTATLAQTASRPQTQQALLEHAVQSMSDPVLVVDARGRIVVANAAARRYLGVDLSITARSNPFRYFLLDGVTRALPEESPLALALQGKDVDDVEYIAEAKATGAREHLTVTARPLRDAVGQLCGAVGVVRNVNRAEAGLSGADRQRTDRAIHRRQRARRLCPDRRSLRHSRLEPACRSPDGLDPRGGDRRLRR